METHLKTQPETRMVTYLIDGLDDDNPNEVYVGHGDAKKPHSLASRAFATVDGDLRRHEATRAQLATLVREGQPLTRDNGAELLSAAATAADIALREQVVTEQIPQIPAA